MELSKKQLSKKLKSLRSCRDWTQENVAEKLGISVCAYAKIELKWIFLDISKLLKGYIDLIMHVISRKALRQFWEPFPDSKNALSHWFNAKSLKKTNEVLWIWLYLLVSLKPFAQAGDHWV